MPVSLAGAPHAPPWEGNLVGNFWCIAGTKLMIILPILRQIMTTIYTFSHITRKNRSFLHICTQDFTHIYNGIKMQFLQLCADGCCRPQNLKSQLD